MSKRLLSGLRPRDLVLYSDKRIIVLNKPSGVTSQPQARQGIRRINHNDASYLLHGLERTLTLNQVPLPVHRLDQHTTGVWLLAKNEQAARDLSTQIQQRAVKKTYLAIVRAGRGSFPSTSGIIDAPIHLADDGNVSIDKDKGRPAVTCWELLGTSDKAPLSLLRLTLQTGKKHQIRLHLAQELKAPILGDTRYSKKEPTQDILNLLPPHVSVKEIYDELAATTQRKKGHSPTNRHLVKARPIELDLDGTDAAFAPPQKRVIFLHAAHMALTRFHPLGPHKKFTLGVTAPLPPEFVELCQRTGLDVYLFRSEPATAVDGLDHPVSYLEGGIDLNGKSLQIIDPYSTIDPKYASQLGIPIPELEAMQGRWWPRATRNRDNPDVDRLR